MDRDLPASNPYVGAFSHSGPGGRRGSGQRRRSLAAIQRWKGRQVQLSGSNQVLGFDTSGDGLVDSFDTNGDGRIDTLLVPVAERAPNPSKQANAVEVPLGVRATATAKGFDTTGDGQVDILTVNQIDSSLSLLRSR